MLRSPLDILMRSYVDGLTLTHYYLRGGTLKILKKVIISNFFYVNS